MALTVPAMTTVTSKDSIVTYTYDTGTNLTEKIDGVTMNSIPSAEGTSRTITISQEQWDSLSFGDHTLEITMNDTVVTRPFKKATAPSMKLPELTKAVTDLAPLHASWKTNLVGKLPSLDASGATNEPFNVLINRIPDGLSWKDALVSKLPLLDASGTNAETLSALINKVPDGTTWKKALVGKLPSLDTSGTNAETLSALINKVPDGLAWKNQVVAKLPSLDASGTNAEPLADLIGKVPNGLVWKDDLVSKLTTLTIPANNAETLSGLIEKIPSIAGGPPKAGDVISQEFGMRYDDSKVWQKTTVGLAASCMDVDKDGNIYISYDAGNSNPTLVKYDPDLNVIWSKNDVTSCIKVRVVGDFVYALYTKTAGTPCVRKLKLDGTEEWFVVGPGGQKDIRVDKEDGKVYVATTDTHRIWCFNPDGTKSYSCTGGLPSDLYDMAIDYTRTTTTSSQKTLVLVGFSGIYRVRMADVTTTMHSLSVQYGFNRVYVSNSGFIAAVGGVSTVSLYGIPANFASYYSMYSNVSIHANIASSGDYFVLPTSGKMWRRYGGGFQNTRSATSAMSILWDSTEAFVATSTYAPKMLLTAGNYLYILFSNSNSTTTVFKFNNKITYV
jgi:hypothetical protein